MNMYVIEYTFLDVSPYGACLSPYCGLTLFSPFATPHRVSVRPTVVCMELHRLSHSLLSLSGDDHLRGCVDAKLHKVMRHWAAIAHIADRPRPFALLHLANLLIFIEVRPSRISTDRYNTS